ncbi:MAG: hypothetical protein LBN25_00935 [Christensenellaceae bacterium]|jgi:ribosomal protein L37E|nr:hypothetical protein [Christensenellaceae bacterium]
MGNYIKCPRCDLNYIHPEDGYCPICKQEIAGNLLSMLVENEVADDAELCPRCGQNYLEEGQRYCETCQQELAALEEIVAPEPLEPSVEGKPEEVVLDADDIDDESLEDDSDELPPGTDTIVDAEDAELAEIEDLDAGDDGDLPPDDE